MPCVILGLSQDKVTVVAFGAVAFRLSGTEGTREEKKEKSFQY